MLLLRFLQQIEILPYYFNINLCYYLKDLNATSNSLLSFDLLIIKWYL